MKKAIRLSLTIFVFILAFSTAFAEMCEVREQGVTQAADFPANKSVSIFGHTHGVTAEVMALARLADDTESSNEAYLLGAVLNLKYFEETLRQYRAEVEILRKNILNGRIQFS